MSVPLPASPASSSPSSPTGPPSSQPLPKTDTSHCHLKIQQTDKPSQGPKKLFTHAPLSTLPALGQGGIEGRGANGRVANGWDSFLPTPPSETELPACKAVVYVPARIHPTALKYAKERFAQVVLGPAWGDEGHNWATCIKGEGGDVAMSGEPVPAQNCQIGQIDGIINRANALSEETLGTLPRLAAISVVGVGYDSISIPTCRERHIAVLNRPGGNADAVGELTIGFTLALLRRINELDRRLRDGVVMLSIDNLGRSLRGKSVGIVGMGSTARRAAELFHHAFGCPILVYSPTSPTHKWTIHDHSLGPSSPFPFKRYSSLEDMLPLCDVLSLHCPLTSLTRGLISTRELELMKEDAVLINMSRGAVVDEAALCSALKEGKVGGAASDVFKVEPASRDTAEGLLDLDNFIGTPHIGGSTVEAQIEVCLQAIDQLADYFDGRPVSNRVV